MPREAEPSLSERTFLSKALDEGLRLDNRKLDQCRPVVLSLGDEYGVADVKFGETRYAHPQHCHAENRRTAPAHTLYSESSPRCLPR